MDYSVMARDLAATIVSVIELRGVLRFEPIVFLRLTFEDSDVIICADY